ncbi:MAG TPA: hypothetical protein DD727_01365, partial [Clostridiales bacterium]|nr:hypothetical protein [Clostridiales bacterium]
MKKGDTGSLFDIRMWVLLVVSLAAALNIANTVSVGISGKRRLCGMYLALGAWPSQVRSILLLETAALAVLALPVGGLLGYCIFRAILAASGGTAFFQTHLYPSSALKIALSSLITILAAALIPANRAMSIPPVEAVKTDVPHSRITGRRRSRGENSRSPNCPGKFLGAGIWLAGKSLRRFKTRILCSIAAIASVLALSAAVSYYIGLEIQKSDAMGDPDFSIFSSAQYFGVRAVMDQNAAEEFSARIQTDPEIAKMWYEGYYTGRLAGTGIEA